MTMPTTRSTPRHLRRPRHARPPRRRASTLLLAASLTVLLSLGLSTLLPAGAGGVDADRHATRPTTSRAHKPKLATTTSSTDTTTTTAITPPTTPPSTTTASPTTAASASGLEIGVNWHAGWSDHSDSTNRAIIDKMAAAGIEWARIDLGWANVFPNGPNPTGQWYIDKIDRAVDYANSKGMKILGIWYYTPGWANGGRGPYVPPTNVNDYASSAQWAASHWKGRIQAWQVWNEPDPIQPFWQGTQDQYVALLKAGYPAFHRGDPSTTVVLGGPSSNDDTWIEGIYARGGRGSFDVLATHPYQGQADAPPEHPDDGHRWWFTHVPKVRNVMLKYGDGAKKIWFTEFGWSSHPNSGSEPSWMRGVTLQQQADYTVRAIDLVRTSFPYVTNMLIYNDRNRTSGNVQVDNYGILYRDLSEKPVYRALRAALGG
jgi:hypothetical protein